MPEQDENPVASGLIALVAVAVVVGLLAGFGALAATRMLGLTGGDASVNGGPAGEQSLYLPNPVPTQRNSAPLVTLPPTASPTETDPYDEPTELESETPSATPSPDISLSAAANQVESGGELLLSGTYPTGEGAVLDIYYNVNDHGWEEFPLDVYVSGGLFQVKVQTYKSGTIKWRVQDASLHLVSNSVTVHHD